MRVAFSCVLAVVRVTEPMLVRLPAVVPVRTPTAGSRDNRGRVDQ
jgi:hypothetical protein